MSEPISKIFLSTNFLRDTEDLILFVTLSLPVRHPTFTQKTTRRPAPRPSDPTMKRSRPTSTSTASSASSHSKSAGSHHPGGVCRVCKKALKSATATAHGSCKRREDEAKASAAAGGGADGGAAKSAGKKRGRGEAGKAGSAAGGRTEAGSAVPKKAKAGKHAASATSSSTSSTSAASVSSAASSSGKKAGKVSGKKASKLSQLQQKFKDKLKGSKFRWINEQLYTATGGVSFDLFQEQPDLFTVYHEGFRSQVEDWPVNPLDLIINRLKDQPKLVIGDFGCGEVRATRVPCLFHTACDGKGLSTEGIVVCGVCGALVSACPPTVPWPQRNSTQFCHHHVPQRIF